jgi:hypothetical protein
MNIRITTFSVLFAATCAISFNTAAHADEEQEARVKPGSLRFDFGANTYALDHVQSRHHYMSTSPGPGSVHSGAAPKNLLGLDPSFLAKPTPMPVAQAPVIAQPTVSAKPIIANNSPFSALFKNPAPSALTAPVANAGQFGKPTPAAIPKIASLPQTHVDRGVHGTVIHASHPRAAVARGAAPIANYGNSFYSPGQVLPTVSSGSGSTTSADVSGSIIHRRK